MTQGLSPSLTLVRRTGMAFGILLMLSVYYLNYGATFDEGEVQGGTLTLVGRLVAVVVIGAALTPYRFRSQSVALLVVVFVVCGCSWLLGVGLYGRANDVLFLNTLLQLPLLVAFTSTRWRIDWPRLLRFAGMVLGVQTAVDAALRLVDISLWESDAFVGGLGNPSSFGFLCGLLFAFYLFHPSAGERRWVMVILMALGAIMSKALLAVLAVAIVSVVWTLGGWRRLLTGLVLALAGATALLSLITQDDETSFIEHKLSAAGALLGLIEYDIETSGSIYMRLRMHEDTIDHLAKQPLGWLFGHLGRQAYWPMDSQVLTYLGSFGALILALLSSMHLYWGFRAYSKRSADGGFAALALFLFGMVFVTNRVLDYFPIATFYFIVIATVVTREACRSGQQLHALRVA